MLFQRNAKSQDMVRRNPKLKYANKPNPERQFINTVFGAPSEDYETNEPIETTTSVFYGKKVAPKTDKLCIRIGRHFLSIHFNCIQRPLPGVLHWGKCYLYHHIHIFLSLECRYPMSQSGWVWVLVIRFWDNLNNLRSSSNQCLNSFFTGSI